MSFFETQLIYYAAPTLLGKKQANLFSVPLGSFGAYKKECGRYQKELASHGIAMVYLYCCEDRIFLMVYREDKMRRYLKMPRVRKYLRGIGYPDIKAEGGIAASLRHLRQRMLDSGEFPHEIVFFLGYPIPDVFAFMENKGQNYKIVGYWKVYGDQETALQTFRRYETCRNQMMRQVSTGVPIQSLLAGV